MAGVSSNNRRIRVLLLTNSVAVGGMEEHVELLARHLDCREFEVFAISPSWAPIERFNHSLSEAADHFDQITPDRRHGTSKLVGEVYGLTARIREWRIDVVHLHSTTYRGQFHALLACRLAGAKRVFVTEHLAPDGDLPLTERVLRDAFTCLVTGVVCVSEKNYRARAQRLYTPAARTLVVNNGVDLKDFPEIEGEKLESLRRELGIPAGNQVIGTVVRFEPEKGLNYLLDAMPAIRAAAPNVTLLMVGDGSLRGELERQAAALGLKDSVVFAGFQSDPRPYLGLLDAFVLPVPVGSMSIGLLEAMAMSRPVVITFGGDGEAVIHGETGFCAEPRKPESIAEYVIQILTNPELKQRLGAAARRRVESAFSAQLVAQSLGRLYAKSMA